MTSTAYQGTELDLFATATIWKAYLSRLVRPYLGQRVLEVGAGVGGTTQAFISPQCQEWLCLEPDPELAGRITALVASGQLPSCCQVCTGTLQDIPESSQYDSILYIDVLEHIEHDRAELLLAQRHLKPGGCLIVLVPAHQWLFSPFDASIGHFRRYTKRSLAAVGPDGLQLVRLSYLDSVGLLASAVNRFILRSSMPNAKQVAFWDRVLVRCSKLSDPVLCYTLGKSVLAVWKRPEAGPQEQRGA